MLEKNHECTQQVCPTLSLNYIIANKRHNIISKSDNLCKLIQICSKSVTDASIVLVFSVTCPWHECNKAWPVMVSPLVLKPTCTDKLSSTMLVIRQLSDLTWHKLLDKQNLPVREFSPLCNLSRTFSRLGKLSWPFSTPSQINPQIINIYYFINPQIVCQSQNRWMKILMPGMIT